MSPSTSEDLVRWLSETREWADRELDRCLPREDAHPQRLGRAMRYAVFGGGKRLRPAVVRLVAKEFGAEDRDAARPAAAIELVHTYSLVHDDLPCMDDDELRRGRPTCHVAFDDATAVLTGDALLTLAFEVLAADPKRGAEQALVLARAAGHSGMVGGQVLDLSLAPSGKSGDPQSLEAVLDMHERKTATLFAAAAEMGALAAGAAPRERELARGFGRSLGRLFQAVDDLLDVTGDARTLGKTPGKDERLDRATLVEALGLQGAGSKASELARATRDAIDELHWDPDGRAGALVDFVISRRA